MLHRATLRLFVAASLALVAACVQQPGKPLAARQAEAIDANRKAELRFRGGDFDGAVQQYREALRIAQSIEDVDGVAANAINHSIAFQRVGKYAEARASLAPVLDQSRLGFPPARLAQAALRRAVLDFDERRIADAAVWLEQAAAWCGQQACTLSSAINNLRGLLALEQGRTDAAAASARAALEASRGSGDRVEAANALRLLGNAAIRAGDAAAALAPLTEALAIDRELALPHKIYLDLVALGRASALGGDRAAARSYYERALAVSEADRDVRAAAEVRDLIGALGNLP
jgi:tetratricopeptide (TPR) repeat protein